MLFLKTVHQKGLLEQMKKKVEFLLLSPDSWKLLTSPKYDSADYQQNASFVEYTKAPQ